MHIITVAIQQQTEKPVQKKRSKAQEMESKNTV